MTYVKQILERYKNYPLFTVRDVKLLLKEYKSSNVNALLGHMARMKKIFRISPGIYTCHNNPEVIGFAYKPFYYGLQDALAIHKIWGQSTNQVIITTKDFRKEKEYRLETNIVLHRINPKYFFGYDLIKINDFNVPVSDLEKTFIDFIHFRIRLDKDTMNLLKKKLNKKKLKTYVEKYPKVIQTQINDAIRIK